MPSPAHEDSAASSSAGLTVVALVGMVIAVVVFAAAFLVLPRLSAAHEFATPTAPAPRATATDSASPVVATTPAPTPTPGICDRPGVAAALSAGDDEGVITAGGGADAFRQALLAGQAPCLSLSDVARRWVVVNKQRPLSPLDVVPPGLVNVPIRQTVWSPLAAPAAEALKKLSDAAKAAGAGEIAQVTGYRSFSMQKSNYDAAVAQRGKSYADRTEARPGYSEHQTGWATNLAACDGECSSLQDFASTPQGRWVTAHAWEYGFIVRYEAGQEDVTGFSAQPWQLRFIGPQLAKAYHDGGFHTLETFFGLPAAPQY